MTPLQTRRVRGPSGIARPRGRLSLCLVIGAAACAPPDRPPDTPRAGATALLSADSAFAADSRGRGADAWAAVWAESGRMQTRGGEDVVGPEQVRSAVTPMLEELGPRFRWTPEHAAFLWPDTLGYTVGRWWIDPDSGDGSQLDGGRYLTAWIGEAGAWKAALDLPLTSCDADTQGAGDFDFWVGDWTVSQRILQADGSYDASFAPAHDTVTRLDGCTLAESWRGTVRFFWEGMTEPRAIRGASLRAYDADAGEWRIYWIDTVGRAFGPPFAGRFREGVGEFLAPPLSEGGQERRIRFSRDADRVHWELALHRPDGSWLPLWQMEFTRST